MSMVLISKTRIPYGGFFKIDLPERGMVGWGSDFEGVRVRVMQYRKANAIPIGLGFEAELECAVCEQYPKECKVGVPETLPQRTITLGWSDVVQGTTIVAKEKLSSIPQVDQAEANRRAAICAKCPMKSNVTLPCSYLCGELAALVSKMVGAKQTPSHSEIDRKACAICHCFIPAMVFVDLSLQVSVLNSQQRKDFNDIAKVYPCWKTC